MLTEKEQGGNFYDFLCNCVEGYWLLPFIFPRTATMGRHSLTSHFEVHKASIWCCSVASITVKACVGKQYRARERKVDNHASCRGKLLQTR